MPQGADEAIALVRRHLPPAITIWQLPHFRVPGQQQLLPVHEGQKPCRSYFCARISRQCEVGWMSW